MAESPADPLLPGLSWILYLWSEAESLAGQPGQQNRSLCQALSDLLACLGVEPGGSTLVIERKPEYQAVN